MKQSWSTGLAAAALAGTLGLTLSAVGAGKVSRGQVPPDFAGSALDGRKVTLSDYRGKNPVLLSFYADFCAPCRKEFQHLKELDEKLGPQGLKIVAVSLDEDRETAAGIPKQSGVKFPVVFDPKNSIAEKYAVQVLPHSVLIDRDGKVHTVIVGVDLDELDRAAAQIVK